MAITGPHAEKIREEARRPRATAGHQAALQVLQAEQRGDADAFYAAGHVLLNSMAQSTKARARKGRQDPLNELIGALVEEFPEDSVKEIIRALSRGIDSGNYTDALYGFMDDGVLQWHRQDRDDDLRDLSHEGLVRRIQRARKARHATAAG